MSAQISATTEHYQVSECKKKINELIFKRKRYVFGSNHEITLGTAFTI
jgi:hypothetical protein